MSLQITEKLLTPNKFSRPQLKILTIKKIVVHWVGNANTTAIANRNYFESLKSGKTYPSSHYIIGLDGEIIMCVPENEIAYHANNANSYSIGIENCHPDWDGKFNDKTMSSLIKLCAQICKKYGLNPLVDIIRHYDVTNKDCPKYYVSHQAEWESFRKKVKQEMTGNNNTDEELEEAVKHVNFKGASIDSSMWGNVSTMNVRYGTQLVTKLGSVLYKNPRISYEEVISNMIRDKHLNSPQIWQNKSFNANHLRSIILLFSSIM